MDKKELSIWVYLNEIEYCLQDETFNIKQASELIRDAREILEGKSRGVFEDCE